MKYPIIKFVFNRRKTATKKKMASVELEVSWQGVRKFKSTGVKVYKDEWNDKSMVIGRDDQDDLNEILNNYAGGLRKLYLKLIEEKREITWVDIDRYLNSHEERQTVASFCDFIEEMIERKNIRPETKKQHYSVLKKLRVFGKLEYFQDLNINNIYLWDEWLRSAGRKQTSIYSNHKVVKVYINEAVRQGLIEANPYAKFKVNRGKSADIKYLQYEDIVRIMEMRLDGTLEKARDMFIVQCFTGMAYKDLCAFSWDEVEQRNGKYVMRDRRLKTEEQYFFVLLPPVIKVLERWDHVLPKLCNVQYNAALKIIQEALDIKTKMTSHVARHSFGVMMINNGIPIDVVAKAMGHSSSKTTEIYAKILGKSVEDAFEILGEKLKM